MFGIDTHGLQHRRRLEGLRGARRARMNRHTRLVEPEQHRFGFDTIDTEAHDVRKPMDRIAEGLHSCNGPG